MKTLLYLIFIFAVISPDYAIASKRLTCKLELTDKNWIGPCGKYNGKPLSLNISVSESVISGIWRSDIEATEVWAGSMDRGGTSTRPVEIEHYQSGVVFARTTFEWFKIADWSQSEDSIEFVMYTEVFVAPSKLDYLIIQRASEILASEKLWNREDNRKCPENAAKWSIYCAILQASIDVTGGSHHRRPALRVVREIIQERVESRRFKPNRYKHPLMDYNNNSATQIDDIQSLFSQAQESIIHSLKSE